MRSFAFLAALVSTAFAYEVLSPNESQGWTNQGAQTLTWQRVDSDPSNFTVLLTNQQVSGYTSQNLAALVDGTLGKLACNPPSGGWPTGSGFRVNLVRDNQNLNSILAQSPTFSITQSSTTAASTTKGTTTAGSAGSTGATVTPPSTTDTSASPSDTLTAPTSGAMTGRSVNAGVIALLSLVGFALA